MSFKTANSWQTCLSYEKCEVHENLKGHLLCPFLQDVILLSGVPTMYL